MIQDARHFLISSDYPMDFIVWNFENTYTVQQDKIQTFDIPHDLPFTPLVFGMYSTDDGESWSPIAAGEASFYLLIESFPTYVKLWIMTFDDPVTIKIRLYAHAPSNASGNVEIMQSSSNFHIDTDYNYSKLYRAGVYDIIQGPEKVVISHGLGYTPQVSAWIEYDGGDIIYASANTSTDTSKHNDNYIRVDNNNLYARFSDTSPSGSLGEIQKLHYRIYADEIGGQ